MNADTLQTLCQAVKEHHHPKARLTYADGRTEVRRLALSSYNTLMVMGKNKRRYGYDLRDLNVTEVTLLPAPDQAAVWRKSWTKVLARLDASGLWPEMAANVRLGLEIGFTTIQAAYEAYWADHVNSHTAVYNVDPRLTIQAEDGTPFTNTEVIWYMNKPAKVKKMYFGKYDNPRCQAAIAAAFTNRTDCTTYGRSGYDVSFEVRPAANKAWYSEEYRGCGNGHYYLALDATHALFYEND